jgi:hypothetical protein
MTKFSKTFTSYNSRISKKMSIKFANETKFYTIWSNHRKYDSKRLLNFFFFELCFVWRRVQCFYKRRHHDFYLYERFDFYEIQSRSNFLIKNALNERFEMNDLNSCIYYLDMMIFKNRNLKQLILNQNVYVEQMLRDHEMWNCKSLIIFMNISCRSIKISDEYIIDKNFKINYQLIVRLLMYIMLKNRSNIIYFISMINHYIFNFIQVHWQTIKRIFRYLRETH